MVHRLVVVVLRLSKGRGSMRKGRRDVLLDAVVTGPALRQVPVIEYQTESVICLTCPACTFMASTLLTSLAI